MIKVNCFKFISLICLIFILCLFIKKVNASTVYSGAGVKINSSYSKLDQIYSFSADNSVYKSDTVVGSYQYYYGLFGYYDEDNDDYYFVEVMFLEMKPESLSSYGVVNHYASQTVSITAQDSDVEMTESYSRLSNASYGTKSKISVGFDGVLALTNTDSCNSSSVMSTNEDVSDSYSFELTLSNALTSAISLRYGNDDINEAFTEKMYLTSVNVTKIEDFSDYCYSNYTFDFSSIVQFYVAGLLLDYSCETNSDNDEDLTSTEFTYRYATGGSDTSDDDSDSPHVISSTRN